MRSLRLIETLVLFIGVLLTLVSSANIFDILYKDFNGQASNADVLRDDGSDSSNIEQGETPQDKSCNCSGFECMCCVDFNVTFIDLGGPGCVRMKYISQKEGVLLNVSYGDNLLKSAVAQGAQPGATCVSLLAQLAAVCARFSSLTEHNDGLKGCLKLEPTLLGDVQTQFDIGCFTMGADGMTLDEVPEQHTEDEEIISTTVSPSANQTEADDNPLANLNEEDILAAVNESAQKGLALFQNWLGIRFTGSPENVTTTQQEHNNASSEEAKSTEEKATFNVKPK